MADGSYPLLPSEVRLYIHDFSDNNHLIDGEEFSDSSILLAMKMAGSDYNTIPPLSNVPPTMFPSVSILMWGTLAHLFLGKAANLARNTMAYSDAGINVSVEERAELYLTLGGQYMQQFRDAASKLKVHLNMEDGWGCVKSDYSALPWV